MIITIDGPAGSGKSTLSIALAKKLGFFCLNSGYLYRGIAYVLKTFYSYDLKKLENPNYDDISACIDSGDFSYRYENGVVKVYFKDEITQFLKSPEIAKAATIIAQDIRVRKIIRNYKYRLIEDHDAVVEGRVCGSVIFPNAEIKLYLTASTDVRAKRFVDDQKQRGKEVSYEKAMASITSRDKVDMEREHDPLIIPVGSIIFDTSSFTVQESLHELLMIVENYMREEKCK